MANRYWVGGTGTWDTSSTTHWASSSNGASGASVPTTADDVIIDSNSGTPGGGINAVGALNCKSLTVSVTGWNINGTTTPSLNIAGKDATNFSLNLNSGTSINSLPITFSSTTTGNVVVTNGATFTSASSITFNGIGGTWTLGSALTAASQITLTAGTFDTGGFNVSCSGVSSTTTTNTRTLNLNGSLVTVTGASPWSVTSTNLTINAGSSTITITAVATATFAGGNMTYWNVSFTGAGGTSAAKTISGTNTYNNLSYTSALSYGYQSLTLSADQTINGTLTISGGTSYPGASRVHIISSSYGTQRTLTAASVSLTDVDFQDTIGAGTASPYTGTRLGNASNNSGITFTAAQQKYFVGTIDADWVVTSGDPNQWSLSSGGSTSSTNFPLPQDTVYIDNNSLNTSAKLTLSFGLYLPTIDFLARTNAMTLDSSATGTSIKLFGSIALSSAITITSSGTDSLTWQNRNISTIKSAGVSWPQSIITNNFTGTVRLLDAFTSTNATTALTLTSGTFDANGFNFTGVKVVSTGSATRTLAIGSGTWTISGTTTTTWSVASTGLTITGSGTISMTGATAKTFAGGSVNYGSVVLNQGGAGALTISGSNTFGDITNTYSVAGATSILFTSGTTQTVATFTATGAATRLLTLNAVTAGSAFTLSKASGTVNADYLSLKDSTATGGASWYAGSNSTNTSGNSGWIFTVVPVGNFLLFM